MRTGKSVAAVPRTRGGAQGETGHSLQGMISQDERQKAATQRHRSWAGLGLVLTALLTVLLGVGAALVLAFDRLEARANEQAQSPSQEPGSAEPGGVAQVAQAVLPSVARVELTGARGQGSGSAVVFDDDGHLVTNSHVVEGANGVLVTLADGSVEEAEVVGTAPLPISPSCASTRRICRSRSTRGKRRASGRPPSRSARRSGWTPR